MALRPNASKRRARYLYGRTLNPVSAWVMFPQLALNRQTREASVPMQALATYAEADGE